MMSCHHNNLDRKKIKSLKKELITCQSDDCPYHVEQMLPSVFIMGLSYIFSGLLVAAICLLPVIYIDNFYFRLLAGLPLSAFGFWGFIVSGAGIYICTLCFFDQYIITDLEGNRYRYITFKKRNKKAKS